MMIEQIALIAGALIIITGSALIIIAVVFGIVALSVEIDKSLRYWRR